MSVPVQPALALPLIILLPLVLGTALAPVAARTSPGAGLGRRGSHRRRRWRWWAAQAGAVLDWQSLLRSPGHGCRHRPRFANFRLTAWR